MLDRFSLKALVLASLLLPLASCSVSPSLTSIAITPNTTVTVTLAPPGVPQGYSQYTAIGILYARGPPPDTEDITNQVTWSSSAPQVATINSSGVATATGFSPTTGLAWVGNTTIFASMPGFGGDIVSNDVSFTVTACQFAAVPPRSRLQGLPSHPVPIRLHCLVRQPSSSRSAPAELPALQRTYNPGRVEFQQCGGCHDWRHHRTCHCGGAGHYADYGPLYKSRQKRGGGYGDLYGNRFDVGTTAIDFHHSSHRIDPGRSNQPADRDWHILADRHDSRHAGSDKYS